jgi:hypothetical protein
MCRRQSSKPITIDNALVRPRPSDLNQLASVKPGAVQTELAPFTEQELCMRQRGNNTSGTPGVTLMTVRRKRADGHVAEEQHWMARLERKGQGRQVKRFSVARYGYERAYELAVQARLAMVATVTGLRLCQTPEQLKPASDARLTVQEQPLPTRPRGGRGVRPD